MKKFLNEFEKIKENIIKTKPLIHHLTNYVTAGDCANACLCFGASPVMADEKEEMLDITSKASALVINLGTINMRTFISMKEAIGVAHKHRVPIILDPVGVMASVLRSKMAKEILELGVSVIRGNYAECASLLGDNSFGKGVDSDNTVDNTGTLAKKLAQKYHCVVAITGAKDAICDGKTIVIAENGNSMLTKVTGTGCMTTTLIASSMGTTDNYLVAALLGITCMNVAAEKAVETLGENEGPGTFKMKLLDKINLLTAKELASSFKGEIFNEKESTGL